MNLFFNLYSTETGVKNLPDRSAFCCEWQNISASCRWNLFLKRNFTLRIRMPKFECCRLPENLLSYENTCDIRISRWHFYLETAKRQPPMLAIWIYRVMILICHCFIMTTFSPLYDFNGFFCNVWNINNQIKGAWFDL